MFSRLSILWQSLESSMIETDHGWRLKFLDFAVSDGKMAIAIDELGNRHLLIPVRSAASGRQEGKALTWWSHKLNVRAFDGSWSTMLFFDIKCEDISLSRQFDHVISSIVTLCDGKTDAELIAKAEVLRWRRLFLRVAEDRALSFKEQLALFGELKTLETLVDALEDFSPSWWTGPVGECHDFELPLFDIEVKTATKNSKAVTIHSLEQLSTKDGRRLYLVLQVVEQNLHGDSVGDILLRLSEKVSSRQELIELATRAGVNFSMNEETFSLVESRIVAVDANFPRIIPENLSETTNTALGQMKYDLVINAFKNHMFEFSGENLKERIS